MDPFENGIADELGNDVYRPGHWVSTPELVEWTWLQFPEARFKASAFVYLVWRRVLEAQGLDPRILTFEELGELVANSRLPSPLGIWTARNNMLRERRHEARRAAMEAGGAADTGAGAIPRGQWPKYGRGA